MLPTPAANPASTEFIIGFDALSIILECMLEHEESRKVDFLGDHALRYTDKQTYHRLLERERVRIQFSLVCKLFQSVADKQAFAFARCTPPHSMSTVNATVMEFCAKWYDGGRYNSRFAASEAFPENYERVQVWHDRYAQSGWIFCKITHELPNLRALTYTVDQPGSMRLDEFSRRSIHLTHLCLDSTPTLANYEHDILTIPTLVTLSFGIPKRFVEPAGPFGKWCLPNLQHLGVKARGVYSGTPTHAEISKLFVNCGSKLVSLSLTMPSIDTATLWTTFPRLSVLHLSAINVSRLRPRPAGHPLNTVLIHELQYGKIDPTVHITVNLANVLLPPLVIATESEVIEFGTFVTGNRELEYWVLCFLHAGYTFVDGYGATFTPLVR